MACCESCGSQTAQKCGNCKKVWYCSRNCQKEDWKGHKNYCGPFEVRECPGKGLGLFTTRDLAIGDLVVREDPILYIEGGTDQILQNPGVFKAAFEKLDKSDKERILALSGAHSNNLVEIFGVPLSNGEEW